MFPRVPGTPGPFPSWVHSPQGAHEVLSVLSVLSELRPGCLCQVGSGFVPDHLSADPEPKEGQACSLLAVLCSKGTPGLELAMAGFLVLGALP